MNKQALIIDKIPALLWGENTGRLLIAVHGNLSNKADVPIAILAEEAVPRGYQVLSFDLPQHGDRMAEPTLCKVQECVSDLSRIMAYAQKHSDEISLFACSMGAYFSLLAYKDAPLKQSLFLSPIVDMRRLIDNMMRWFDISEERLQVEQEIQTPAGQPMYWDYYCYVKENPIVRWTSPTAILYGKEDNLCEHEVITSFAQRFDCDLDVLEKGEHYCHTPEQLRYYREWLRRRL